MTDCEFTFISFRVISPTSFSQREIVKGLVKKDILKYRIIFQHVLLLCVHIRVCIQKGLREIFCTRVITSFPAVQLSSVCCSFLWPLLSSFLHTWPTQVYAIEQPEVNLRDKFCPLMPTKHPVNGSLECFCFKISVSFINQCATLGVKTKKNGSIS